MTAKWIYARYGAKSVLDPFAGWGGRLLGAMALDVDYTGIDSNVDLQPGYRRIQRLYGPLSQSLVRMIFKPVESVNLKNLRPFDCVLTSPPYEDLENYPHMPQHNDMYQALLLPLFRRVFAQLQPGGWMCLNVPETLAARFKADFGPPSKVHSRALTGRHQATKAEKTEGIYCWRKPGGRRGRTGSDT